jgi:phosphoribosylaminoimidazolecarboxamide formyltransferase/IMP cyclohydrolase
VATGENVQQAYERAFAADPLSAFGGVIVLNRPVDRGTAGQLVEQFAEVIFAPAYEEGALEILTQKPNTRILEDNERRSPLFAEPEIKQVMGGLLVQDRDIEFGDRTEMEVVTKREPTDAEWQDLLFAWQVCKHVRSNAIVLAKDHATAGIGAGQMSRVDSVRLAIDKSRLESLAGSVLASDAFFPFSDGPEIAIAAGITAIIQPGGSRRDPEVVEAADKAGIAMVFTSRRHFRH